MKQTTRNRATVRWGTVSVVPATMTALDVPFTKDPLEVIPTEQELEEMRAGFAGWMENQTGLLSNSK